jgi:hypothetical protein
MSKLAVSQLARQAATCFFHVAASVIPLQPAPLSRSCSRRGSSSGYAVLRGEKAPDDALAREVGAMGLL